MDFDKDFTFTLTPDYLLVGVEGRFSVEFACRIIDKLIEKSLETNEKRALMDLRKMAGKFSIMDRYQVGLHGRALISHQIKVVLIGRHDQVFPEGVARSFLETVLVNRGVQARVFTDFEEGERWLTQFSPEE